MEQDPRFSMYSQPEPKKDDDSKKFLITIIVMLSVALVGLAALYIYNVSKNSQSGEEAEKTSATSNQTTSNIPTTNSSISQTTPAVVTEPEPTVPVEVKKADLYVKSYSFSKDPKVGSEFVINVVIGNKGQIASPESYWEWWSTASKQSCKKKVGAISAGGTSAVQCEFTYSDWSDYATKVVVDSQNDVSESDEENNVATKQVTPKHKKADLTITKYEFNHDPKMGEEFKVEITIKNKGETDAKSVEWEWWSTNASSSCDGKVDKIEAGESETVSCKYTYAGWSTYSTKASVDPDDDIDEEEEDNNVSTKTIIPIH